MSATEKFHSLDLSSRFQPICSVAERRAIGCEALLTARDSRRSMIDPVALFASAEASGEAVYLDWLARALHLRNFAMLAEARDSRIFLNVGARTALEDLRFPSVFAAVMESFGVDPAHVVVEILEDAVPDESRLADAVAYYRAFGCTIALDDFGTSASGEERLVRLRPDVVKVARALVTPAVHDSAARRRLFETVAAIHAFGATAVLEGVETREEAQIALDSGAECVQGFYFARPLPKLPDAATVARRFRGLTPARARQSARAPRPAPWPARAFGTAW